MGLTKGDYNDTLCLSLPLYLSLLTSALLLARSLPSLALFLRLRFTSMSTHKRTSVFGEVGDEVQRGLACDCGGETLRVRLYPNRRDGVNIIPSSAYCV